ncbi:hypothetical protein K8T06_09125 [bacterium]|nr:hypothetical protein [bacterium]
MKQNVSLSYFVPIVYCLLILIPMLISSVSAGWSTSSSCAELRLVDIWNYSESDAWAVGIGGRILHWNGFVWEPAISGTDHNLHAVWGSGSSDVYAVGEDHILHWNGVMWSTETVSENLLQGIWGTGPDNVYITGGSTVLHGNHLGWSQTNIPEVSGLADIWGTSDQNIYVLANDGKYVHFDGTSWKTFVIDSNYQLMGIYGFSENDIYMVGYDQAAYNSLILHWDGTCWQRMTTDSTASLYDIWGSASDDIYSVGGFSYGAEILHWDGVSWDVVPENSLFFKLFGVHGMSSDNLFAVGDEIARLEPGIQSLLDLEFSITSCLTAPGDNFELLLNVVNSTNDTYSGATLCALEVYGEFFFWPSWNNEFDHNPVDFPENLIAIHILPEFTWPDTGTGTVTGLNFWALVMDPSLTDVVSNLAVVSWGYGI